MAVDDRGGDDSPGAEPPGGDGGPPGGTGSRIRGGRRAVLITVGAAVVLAATVTVAVMGGPDTIEDVGGPVAAVRIADHRPDGPALRNAPYDCGMSRAVLDRLAGSAEKMEQQSEDSDRCTWGGSSNAGEQLEVDLQFSHTDAGKPDAGAALGDLMLLAEGARGEVGGDKAGPVTPLTGLGAQAVAWTEVAEHADTPLIDKDHPRVWHGDAGTTIVFQAGNVAARITYQGVDRSKDGVDLTAHPLEKSTWDGALAAATSLARQVGTPVRGTPAQARPPGGPHIRKLPAACSIAPAGTVRSAADNRQLKPKRDDSNSLEDEDTGLAADRCEWEGGLGHSVDVEWQLEKENSAPGDGTSVARLQFERQFHDARDTPEGAAGQSVFTALSGLGDQAFASYDKDDTVDGGHGTVLVQKRNALIRVRCRDINAYPPDEALNCAYAVARAAADRVEA